MSDLQNSELKIGVEVEGEIFKITNFGAFVKLSDGKRALIHISQIADDFVKNIDDHLKLGDKVKARVIGLKKGKVDLTLKKQQKANEKDNITSSYPDGKSFKFASLADKLNNFLTKGDGTR